MSRLSLLYPTSPPVLEPLLRAARAVDGLNLDRLWFGQLQTFELHQVAAYLAGAGIRTPVGAAVTLAPLRAPYEAAVAARSVAALTGLPFVAGYGPGAPEVARGLIRGGYRRPRVAMVEYLRSVRDLLAGGHVDHEGEYHATCAQLLPLAAPPIELGAGVLRPAMAEAMGEVADVAITLLTPPSYVAERIAPGLLAGATAVGRAAPRIATIVHAAVEHVGRDPYLLAERAASAHLAKRHYADMLCRAGVPVDPADPLSGARAIVDSAVFVYGTRGDIADEIRRYHAAGVDEVVLNLCGVLATEGVASMLRDLAAITAALRQQTAIPSVAVAFAHSR
ncbi:LLM class flavin-dependent oxidoreductase [Actinokineospora sp. UTMC 2448]|uniref:LLM class flavin-dependent oxidoreductase n=1 Tax=Actinokineospora sp. UTMC 2448 TaxID=2268449 RepID=UPI002164AFAA|nr:LLM class flavin-dependent oxidoreductase [Actinokineospora sp. UTMC 2448]UVS81383.1 F420-dependent oxidoreductase, family [Actinokineospora sp. UTMC 2448]